MFGHEKCYLAVEALGAELLQMVPLKTESRKSMEGRLKTMGEGDWESHTLGTSGITFHFSFTDCFAAQTG